MFLVDRYNLLDRFIFIRGAELRQYHFHLSVTLACSKKDQIMPNISRQTHTFAPTQDTWLQNVAVRIIPAPSMVTSCPSYTDATCRNRRLSNLHAGEELVHPHPDNNNNDNNNGTQDHVSGGCCRPTQRTYIKLNSNEERCMGRCSNYRCTTLDDDDESCLLNMYSHHDQPCQLPYWHTVEDAEHLNCVEQFLHDVYIGELNWTFAASNPSGLRVVVDDEEEEEENNDNSKSQIGEGRTKKKRTYLVDELSQQSTWIILYVRDKLKYAPTTEQDTGIVACLRVIHPHDVGNRMEIERYLTGTSENIKLYQSLEELPPNVEANRLAISAQWRTIAGIAPFMFHLAFTFVLNAYAHRCGLIISSAHRGVQTLSNRYGAKLLSSNFFYDRNHDPEPCHVYYYDPITCLPAAAVLAVQDIFRAQTSSARGIQHSKL